MSSSIYNIVQSIHDSQNAKIILIIKGGEKIILDCIFKEDEAPSFYLVFPPDKLPENIDTSAAHPVSVSQDDKTISFNASINELKGDRTLHMQAKAIVDPASLREYFRVNTAVKIMASYHAGNESSKISWKVEGQTQDISGSGVLALFPDELKNRDNILVELYLPDKNTLIHAFTHIVRQKPLRSKRWQVSFHFDNISTKHRDAIITYLLREQRKQLRERVFAWDQ